MRISPVGNINPSIGNTGIARVKVTQEPIQDFKNAVTKAVSEVNNMQNNADKAAVKMATGDVEDVHEAMIAMQKAKLALDFTIQVRNKVIEAYQEIMRMQV